MAVTAIDVFIMVMHLLILVSTSSGRLEHGDTTPSRHCGQVLFAEL